jgi:precorrin-6B methylase 1
MARITVIGVGPGPASCLTKEAEAELLRADKVFFRMGAHPVYK